MTRKRGGRRRGGKREGAHTSTGAQDGPSPPPASEQPVCLLKDLPAPVMRQLVQQHLGSDECVALLGTCRQLGRAVVQHRTHDAEQHKEELRWAWRALRNNGSVSSTTATRQVATAARLLVEWAPAELHVSLSGTAKFSLFGAGTPGTPISLPAALLPLITTLTLRRMHVAPSTMDLLQQCQRLRTLDVDECSFADADDRMRGLLRAPSRARGGASLEQALSQLRLKPLQPLPGLRTLRVSLKPEHEVPAWAAECVIAACARAAMVRGGALLDSIDNVDGGAGFTEVEEWDLEGEELSQERLEALLQFPSLRRVAAGRLDLYDDARDAACTWEALTLRQLAGVKRLLRLPSGLGRVVVSEHLSFVEPEEEGGGSSAEEERLAERLWWGPGRLRVQVDMPPREEDAELWCLDDEQRQAGYFSVSVGGAGGVVPHSVLQRLRREVLPPGGGPRTLDLGVAASGLAATLRQLAPALAGSRVRDVCNELLYLFDDSERAARLGGVLCALPNSVARLRLRMAHPELRVNLKQAEEILSGPAAGHPLTVVLLFSVLPHVDRVGLSHAQESRLRDLCAQRQPSVQLEIVERRHNPEWR